MLLSIIEIIILLLSVVFHFYSSYRDAQVQSSRLVAIDVPKTEMESFSSPLPASELRGIMYPPKLGPLRTTLQGAYEKSGQPFAAIYSDAPFIAWSDDPKPVIG